MEARSAIVDRGPPKDFASKYLSDDENKQDLLDRMDPSARAEWLSYGHLRIEPAFQDRVFIVYRPTGRNNAGIQRMPEIIAQLRVLSFVARDETGCVLRLLNETTNEVEEVTHVPKKIFGFPIFMAVPPSFTLRWDVHRHGSQMQRTLSYTIFIKTLNKSSFFSTKNLYAETPNNLRQLYSHLDLQLDLK